MSYYKVLRSRIPRNDDFLKRACAGFRHSVVLIARTATYSDGTHDFAVTLQGNASGEDHDFAIVRGVNPEKLAA